MEDSYDPFTADVEPYDQEENMQLYPAALMRSMMWDMIGEKMITEPERFGATAASPDVLDAEYQDMVRRHYSLLPFGPSINMSCQLAAEAVTKALFELEPELDEMDSEERASFLDSNIRVSTAVTRTVLGHLIQKGLIHHGAH